MDDNDVGDEWLDGAGGAWCFGGRACDAGAEFDLRAGARAMPSGSLA